MEPRYAQEDHTHDGLTGGSGGGEWAGVYTAVHSSSAGALSSIGLSTTTGGSSSSVDTTLSLSGTHMQSKPRFVRKYSAYYGGWVGSATHKYLNSMRGFHARWVFGTLAYNNANPLFAGLFYTAPSSGGQFNTTGGFTGWPSVYSMGICKNQSADTIDFVWRTDASTTGLSSSGLSWRDGYVYQLDLECDSLGASVDATLSCSYGEEASYTFTTFPDANSNPACLLLPGVFVGGTGTTTQMGFCTYDCMEPW